MSSSKVVAKFSQSYAANNFPDSANEILNEEQETLLDASQMSNSSSEPKSRRWTWNDEKITSLIGCLYEYKVKKDFEGKDIEADLIKFYEDIRQLMARLYPSEDFGMEEIDELPTDADDQEKLRLQKIIAEQTKQIKTGYGRIKSRIKIIRQNFKRAVVAGTRSGSGKIIIQNWDELLMIWGSCPSVKRIDGPVMTKTMNEVESDDSTSNDIPQDNDEEILEEPSAYPKRKARPLDSSDEEESSKPLRLKDKKRSKMEKPLSSRQRDEVMLRVAREELELKKKNAEILQNSAKGMEAMVGQMSKSLTALGQQLGNGLAILAQAISTNPNQQFLHQQSQQHFMSPVFSYCHPETQNKFQKNSTTFTSMLGGSATQLEEEEQRYATSDQQRVEYSQQKTYQNLN